MPRYQVELRRPVIDTLSTVYEVEAPSAQAAFINALQAEANDKDADWQLLFDGDWGDIELGSVTLLTESQT